jgi:hypothetical protein
VIFTGDAQIKEKVKQHLAEANLSMSEQEVFDTLLRDDFQGTLNELVAAARNLG